MRAQHSTSPVTGRGSWGLALLRPRSADLAYADLSARATAFVIDLVIASGVVFVLAWVVGTLVRGRLFFGGGALQDDPILLAVELLAAIGCVLPTALFAYAWHRSGATPGMRVLGLRVVHHDSEGNLPLRAAFARWVLLFAPLALLVAYPQIVIVSIAPDTFLYLHLVEMPWLPALTMSAAVAWYLLLAYPALKDEDRRRALHDDLSGSVVVRDLAGAGQERARTARAADIANLVPFSWLRGLGAPWYAWLLLVAAAVMGAAAVSDVAGAAARAEDALPLALYLLGQVCTVLVPAAFVLRVPRAAARYPLLVIGLTLVALAVVGRWLVSVVGISAVGAITAAGDPLAWLASLGPLVVALGLLSLRRRGPSRPGLLVALGVLFLAFPAAQLALVDNVSATILNLTLVALAAIVAAVAAWVPLSTWLDLEPPRPFWALLALTAGLAIVQGVVGVGVLTVTDPSRAAAIQPVASLVAGVCTAGIGLFTLLAYALFAPRD